MTDAEAILTIQKALKPTDKASTSALVYVSREATEIALSALKERQQNQDTQFSLPTDEFNF